MGGVLSLIVLVPDQVLQIRRGKIYNLKTNFVMYRQKLKTIP